jgi:hypothetical protein
MACGKTFEVWMACKEFIIKKQCHQFNCLPPNQTFQILDFQFYNQKHLLNRFVGIKSLVISVHNNSIMLHHLGSNKMSKLIILQNIPSGLLPMET